MDCVISHCETIAFRNSVYCKLHTQRWKRFRGLGFLEDHFRDLQNIPACELCGKEDTNPLCTDHDHNHCPANTFCPTCVRGMICISCNFAMGKIDSQFDWFQKAVAYKEHYDSLPPATVVRRPVRRRRQRVDQIAFDDGVPIYEGGRPLASQWTPPKVINGRVIGE